MLMVAAMQGRTGCLCALLGIGRARARAQSGGAVGGDPEGDGVALVVSQPTKAQAVKLVVRDAPAGAMAMTSNPVGAAPGTADGGDEGTGRAAEVGETSNERRGSGGESGLQDEEQQAVAGTRHAI